MKNRQGMRSAQRILLTQLVVAILLAMIVLVPCGATSAISAIAGGLVCVIPNALFIKQLFWHNGARAAKQIVNNFYKGEALKLVLSMALFTMIFKFITINPLVFFVAYIAVQMVFWFAPLIIVNKK